MMLLEEWVGYRYSSGTIFCDASTKAYGAVAYFCQGSESLFAVSKHRVSLKQLTLLMDATVSAQMFT